MGISVREGGWGWGCGCGGRRRRSSRYLVRRIDLVRIADMDVIEKISKEARRAVMARAEGLPSWKPAAPGIGVNSVYIFLY